MLDFAREILKEEINKRVASGPHYGKSRRHKFARADVLATRNRTMEEDQRQNPAQTAALITTRRKRKVPPSLVAEIVQDASSRGKSRRLGLASSPAARKTNESPSRGSDGATEMVSDY